MDAAGHDANVARIREWLEARAGRELSVTAHTGPNAVPIASGVFLGVQEHPVSKGVFRAQFRDDRRVSINPDEEKFIMFGAELVGVETADDRLVLDKGSQTIEIREVAAVPRSEDVTWEAAASPAAAPPPPPPAPVAPAAIPPAAAPAGHGQVFEMQVTAPFYDNSYGSGFVGPVTIRIEQGLATVTGRRAPKRTMMAMAGWGLSILGAIGLVFGLVVAANASGDSDMGFAFCLMGVGLLLVLPGLALYFVARSKAMRSGVGSMQFRLADTAGGRARYDSNLGCLFMLLLSPLIGLIIMLAMGRRIVGLTVPNDRPSGPARQMLALKARTPADGAVLERALRG